MAHGTAQRLLGYAFLHYGPFHFLFACLLYPLAAGKIERDVGTFQFMYINLLLSVLVAILYIVSTWILELMTFFYIDMSSQCIAGLDILFLVYLTVEALAVDDPLVQQPFPADETTPKIMYPIAFLVIMHIFMPYTMILAHVSAIIIDFSKVLHFLLLPPKFITALESARVFSSFIQRDGYVAAPGGIALPDHFDGDFGDIPAPRTTQSQSIFGRFKSAVGGSYQKSYLPIHNDTDGLLKSDPDVDPLWNDIEGDVVAEEGDSSHQFVVSATSSPKK